jgi:CRISPR-associated protein Cas5t
LEARVVTALTRPDQIERFGGLSLGESTHMVDEVAILPAGKSVEVTAYLLDPTSRGRLSLPVWVDHIGSAGTRRVSGNLETLMSEPPLERMPKIEV